MKKTILACLLFALAGLIHGSGLFANTYKVETNNDQISCLIETSPIPENLINSGAHQETRRKFLSNYLIASITIINNSINQISFSDNDHIQNLTTPSIPVDGTALVETATSFPLTKPLFLSAAAGLISIIFGYRATQISTTLEAYVLNVSFAGVSGLAAICLAGMHCMGIGTQPNIKHEFLPQAYSIEDAEKAVLTLSPGESFHKMYYILKNAIQAHDIFFQYTITQQ
jgi:hypothetical protein